MSAGSFADESGAMSKAEKLAWLHFGLLLIAAGYMGWLWWSSWPDTEVLRRNANLFGQWLNWLVIVAIASVWLIKLRGPKEPLADERDRAINGEARTNGFAALAIMVYLMAVLVHVDGWQAQVTPPWMSLAMMSMLALALLVDAGCRIVRYRWPG